MLFREGAARKYFFGKVLFCQAVVRIGVLYCSHSQAISRTTRKKERINMKKWFKPMIAEAISFIVELIIF